MFSRLVTLLFASLFLFGTAQAQSKSSLDSPTCMMWSEAPLYGSLLDRYSHELYIWYWHAYGFSEVSKLPNWVNRQDQFAECFENKTKGNCGFKANRSIQKALAKNRTDGFGKKPLKDLFQESPPPAAVRFAMQSLGTCFGNDPALPTLEELGLVSGDFEMNACGLLARETTYALDKLPAEMASHASWGFAFDKYMSKLSNPTPRKACGVIPKAGLPYYESIIEGKRQRQIAYENRTIAQRIAGLDAFDIAFSLISRTKSGEHTPTRPLPVEALEWVEDYVEQVDSALPPPSIPETVQQWAVEQPLDTFDQVEDPFAARRRLRPYEITSVIWASYVRLRLNEVAPNEARIAATEGCSILWGIVWGDMNFGRRGAGSPGEREFYRLVRETPDKWAWTVCEEMPVNIFYDAKATYQRRLDEQAYAAANPPPPTIWDELAKAADERRSRPSVSSAPYKSSSTRCYDTGQTESGLTNRVCFTN